MILIHVVVISSILCVFTLIVATLQDEKNLYFVQQFVPGGDLFSLLHSPRLSSSKLGGLPAQQAAFYLANTLVILEYLHEQEVMHRDLKPENLVRFLYFSLLLNIILTESADLYHRCWIQKDF